MAQDLPFQSISPAPETFSSEHLIIRMIQGLGFRYFWATEGLREVDLEYSPSESGQTCRETLEHIHGLAEVIANSTQNKATVRPPLEVPRKFKMLRSETLAFLKIATEQLKKMNPNELEALQVIFERGGGQTRFPLWNLINGPISDAIYHTGQVVSFRRSSGNPISKGVNVFLGVKN